MGAFLDKVPHFGGLPLFQHILGACRKWKNIKLARRAFEYSLQLDEMCVIVHDCMRNTYAAARMQIEVDEIEALRA